MIIQAAVSYSVCLSLLSHAGGDGLYPEINLLISLSEQSLSIITVSISRHSNFKY